MHLGMQEDRPAEVLPERSPGKDAVYYAIVSTRGAEIGPLSYAETDSIMRALGQPLDAHPRLA